MAVVPRVFLAILEQLFLSLDVLLLIVLYFYNFRCLLVALHHVALDRDLRESVYG